MTEMISLLLGGTGLLALLLFGLVPAFVVRLVALCFPESDERRAEMIAEFRAVPRLDQPFWALQQVERIFFEAIPARRGHRTILLELEARERYSSADPVPRFTGAAGRQIHVTFPSGRPFPGLKAQEVWQRMLVVDWAETDGDAIYLEVSRWERGTYRGEKVSRIHLSSETTELTLVDATRGLAEDEVRFLLSHAVPAAVKKILAERERSDSR